MSSSIRSLPPGADDGQPGCPQCAKRWPPGWLRRSATRAQCPAKARTSKRGKGVGGSLPNRRRETPEAGPSTGGGAAVTLSRWPRDRRDRSGRHGRRRRRRHGEGRHRRLGERVGGWSAWPQGRHVRLAGHLRPCEVCGERTGPRIAATVTPTSTATRPVREWDEESGSGAALGEPPRLGFSDGDDTPPAVGRPAAARRSRSRRRPPSRRTARCIPGRRLPEVQLHAGVAQRPWHRRADSRDDRASRRAHQERRHRGD